MGARIELTTSIVCYRLMYFGRKYIVSSLKTYFKLSFEKVWGEVLKICELEVRESVHRDTTMKITKKMHYID